MLRVTIFALLIIFSSQNSAAKIYKWVDENGQIHYSSQKPVDQKAETVNVRKGPKVTPKAATDSAEEDQAVAADDEEIDEDAQAEAKKQLAASDAVNRKKQCDMARKNYAALNATVRVVRTNENGETVRMSDDERVTALATAQKAIDRYCN